MLYISTDTKTRKCKYPNCNFVFLHKLKHNKLISSSRYCYKHQNEDYYQEISNIEKKLFESDLLNFELTIKIKINISSYFKFLQIKDDIDKLIYYYMKLIKLTKYDNFTQKYILFLEYKNYLNDIKINRKNILSNGLKIEDFSFYNNVQFIIKKNSLKRNTRRGHYDTFFFGGIKQCKDLFKLKIKLEKDKYEIISNKLNFYNTFSEDVEDLIYKYYINIDLEYDDPFYDSYIQRLRLNLDFKNNIIIYKNLKKNKVKFCYINNKK